MSIRISVIVAVYNTGEFIEPLIASLLGQTMPPEQWEAIFVDDGSTDDTPARLDRLAAEHDNVIVRHEPNSGWPGRPRNVGFDLARGDYVFFADHDDWFKPEAFERMVAYADECGSDVLVPRYAGHHRGVAKALFDRDRPAATLTDAPLMDSLTPHKLFRAAFLRDAALRFPEGRRRLEDHVFVVAAYFRARTISVLADYCCYVHIGRTDAANAGYQQVDPAYYYGFVREVVALYVTASGDRQDVLRRCMLRTLRQEILGRLDGRAFTEQDRDYQRALFDVARGVAMDCIPEDIDESLSPQQRTRAWLLRADRFDDLLAHVGGQTAVSTSARLLDQYWNDSGRLVLSLEASLVDRAVDRAVDGDADGDASVAGAGRPWVYETRGDRVLITSPVSLPDDVHDVTDVVERGTVKVLVRRRADSEEWPVTVDVERIRHEADGRVWISYRGTAAIDPRTLGGGRPLLDGTWDLYVAVSECGWSKETRLGNHRAEPATSHRRALLGPDIVALPYWTTPYDNLSLELNPAYRTLHRRLGLDEGSVRLARGTLRVELPASVSPAPPTAVVRLHGPGGSVDVPASASCPDDSTLRLDGRLPRLRPGFWRVELGLDVPGWPGTAPTGATVAVRRLRARRVVSDEHARRTRAQRATQTAGRNARRVKSLRR